MSPITGTQTYCLEKQGKHLSLVKLRLTSNSTHQTKARNLNVLSGSVALTNSITKTYIQHFLKEITQNNQEADCSQANSCWKRWAESKDWKRRKTKTKAPKAQSVRLLSNTVIVYSSCPVFLLMPSRCITCLNMKYSSQRSGALFPLPWWERFVQRGWSGCKILVSGAWTPTNQASDPSRCPNSDPTYPT